MKQWVDGKGYVNMNELAKEHSPTPWYFEEVLDMLKKLDDYFSIIEEPHLHDEITTLIAKIEAKK